MAGHCNLNIKLKKALSITVPTCSSNMALLQHPAQKFCCNKPIFVMTNICRYKINVCCDKTFVTQAYFYCDKCGYAKICLSWQKFCHNKIIVSTFVATKMFCCDKHNFVATKVLSQQMFCCGQDTLVETKRSFVMTKVCLLQQNFCHDKHVFVRTKCLLQQKWYLWQLSPMIWGCQGLKCPVCMALRRLTHSPVDLYNPLHLLESQVNIFHSRSYSTDSSNSSSNSLLWCHRRLPEPVIEQRQ